MTMMISNSWWFYIFSFFLLGNLLILQCEIHCWSIKIQILMDLHCVNSMKDNCYYFFTYYMWFFSGFIIYIPTPTIRQDVSPLCYPQEHWIYCTHLYNFLERTTVRVKCLLNDTTQCPLNQSSNLKCMI